MAADQTSYINYIKPLILALELDAPHVLSIIDTKDDWYFKIHPQRMVPALKDSDPETGDTVIVFESTACLQYLGERFDKDGKWVGRNASEKGRILAWTSYQTAALGLKKDTLRQWDILEKRLAESGQAYIALKDRPTIADISYLPFSMPYMFNLFGVSIHDWPHIDKWSEKMLGRQAVRTVLEQAPRFGHDV
ncbi:uncharacterized protein E0L32_011264 [Thyridium curvatum]|uniref:glutathione transferase n=1 Tax=Thyridium curvatum TaxID=1093900 RepID=A0A507BQD4_9PEZI|nr:uncharacterized protein E0L32_011264 [Thyridium curvatum]TPX19020.1 hypothetical protein E0L32_011264 [Thyridium curvatum]